MSEKIMTLHPEGKTGVNIDRTKYEIVRGAILRVVGQHPGLTFNELVRALEAELYPTFHGSIAWYTVSVKLDLEARGLIERLPNSSPQRLQLVEGD